MADVAVVGAGLGGLSAAIALAIDGHNVRLFEAHAHPGGKAGTVTVDGCTFDTGPSVMTLPHVAEELFSAAGHRMSDAVTLIQPAPAFRYRFHDGTSLDVHHDLIRTAESIEHALGSDARSDFDEFMKRSASIWETAAPNFVYGPAPSLWSVTKLGPKHWSAMLRIDGFRSMHAALTAGIRSEHLRTLLARYATYNGSDPRKAPATLNCIAHVEMGLGGFGIRGGLHALVTALHGLAEQLGVRFHFNSKVTQVITEGRRAVGVTVNGERVPVDSVVVNADFAQVRNTLLSDSTHRLPKPGPPSMSGYNLAVRTRSDPKRAGHNVLFAERYLNEFDDIFVNGTEPATPTVYACDPTIAHQIEGWSDGTVPLFLMANAPATDSGTVDAARLRRAVLDGACAAGWIDRRDPVVWERTPELLAERFPGSHGSLYGAASHGLTAAFQRPSNRVSSIDGLYLASGSAHPGGGVPLAILSGRAAAEALRSATDNKR